MNIGKIIRALLVIALLMMIFHPIMTIIFLVKFGGVIFTVCVISIIVKLSLGMSLIDILKGKADDK